MKNKCFYERLKFAIQGLKQTWKTERSFRAQISLTVVAIILLLIVRPQMIWWAVFLLIFGAVLAAELFNTALENMIDHLHPEVHPAIGRMKDCAAGAVLILSLSALGILTCFLIDHFLK